MTPTLILLGGLHQWRGLRLWARPEAPGVAAATSETARWSVNHTASKPSKKLSHGSQHILTLKKGTPLGSVKALGGRALQAT